MQVTYLPRQSGRAPLLLASHVTQAYIRASLSFRALRQQAGHRPLRHCSLIENFATAHGVTRFSALIMHAHRHNGTKPSPSGHAWRSLDTPATELQLQFTLPTGQSFRWRKTAENEYTGVIRGRLVSPIPPHVASLLCLPCTP